MPYQERSQRKADQSPAWLNSADQMQSSNGQPLKPEIRTALEPQFGHSFSDVRVFSDTQADRMARDMDAAAFTVGQDVYFRDGLYNPASTEGLQLLTHELTHTIQQRGAKPDTKPLELGQRDDSSEREAHIASSAVMRGGVVNITASSPVAVQRFGWSDGFGLNSLGSWFGGTAAEVEQQRKPDGSNPAIAAGVDMAKKGSGAFGFAQKALDYFTKEKVPNAEGTGLIDQSHPVVGGIGKALKFVDAGLDVASSKADGQGWGEAISGGAGKLFSSLIGSKGATYAEGSRGASADSWVNAISKVAGIANEGAKALGFSKSVTDTTQGVADGTSLAADVTPSTMQENILKQGFRGIWNIGSGIHNAWDQLSSGDYEGALLKGGSSVDKQVKDMKAGKSGAPLQGYAMLTDIIADVRSGKDLESTILKTGSQGSQTTSGGRVGTWLGDQAYRFINKDLPEARQLASKDSSLVGHGMDFVLNNPLGLGLTKYLEM